MPIRDLPAYLFTAFLRHVNRLKHKELTLVRLSEIAHLPGTTWADPLRQLEIKILLDECLAYFDFIDQDMALRKSHGRSWKEAGKVHGLSAHAAEARFSRAVKQVRERLKIEIGKQPKAVQNLGDRVPERLRSATRANAQQKEEKGI